MNLLVVRVVVRVVTFLGGGGNDHANGDDRATLFSCRCLQFSFRNSKCGMPLPFNLIVLIETNGYKWNPVALEFNKFLDTHISHMIRKKPEIWLWINIYYSASLV